MTEPAPTLSTTPLSAADLDHLAASGQLYAAIDATALPFVPDKVKALGPHKAVCLYRGGDETQYAAVAPYLFRVDQGVMQWIRDAVLQDPAWGVFGSGNINLEGLRRHFRRFLVVLSPAGQKMSFRFYDPRVLTTFLDCCTAAELDDFFGPLDRLGIAAEAGAGALCFRRLVESRPRRRDDILLRLRPAQMRAFARASEDRFADRLVSFLQEQFPDAAGEPRGSLRAAVVEQLGRAREYGFVTETQLTTYVVTAWLLGAEFDSDMPAARHMLRSQMHTPDDKALWLERFTEKLFRTLEDT
jgi:hypothetical protein